MLSMICVAMKGPKKLVVQAELVVYALSLEEKCCFFLFGFYCSSAHLSRSEGKKITELYLRFKYF